MPTDQADLISQQDQQRTARSFISFLTTAFGVDQQPVGVDGTAANTPYRYQAIGPTGVGIEGAPVSSAQPVAAGISPVLLLAAGAVVAFLLVK